MTHLSSPPSALQLASLVSGSVCTAQSAEVSVWNRTWELAHHGSIVQLWAQRQANLCSSFSGPQKHPPNWESLSLRQIQSRDTTKIQYPTVKTMFCEFSLYFCSFFSVFDRSRLSRTCSKLPARFSQVGIWTGYLKFS